MKQIEKETKLEVQILKWLALKYPEIAEQIKQAKITKREYSGKGFFFELLAPQNTNPTDEKIRTFDGPQIENKKLKFGGGSILFLKNGYIEMLEVFAYGDTFSEYLDEFELQEGNIQKFDAT